MTSPICSLLSGSKPVFRLVIAHTGRTAADASIATAFALSVEYGNLGGPGGGGFVTGFINGQPVALDFREKAPMGASQSLFLDSQGNCRTDLLGKGHLASGVPGMVYGMWEVHQRFGRKDWKGLLEPAINLTTDLDYRRTLQRIAEFGAADFYLGETSRLIVEEMKGGKGIITAADLVAYRPIWRNTIVFKYKNAYVIGNALPSSGGITTAVMAKIFGKYDYVELKEKPDLRIHLMLETFRRGFLVRNFELADSDFFPGVFPLEKLLSEPFADSLRDSIDPKQATSSKTLYEKFYGPLEDGLGIQPGSREMGHTTHFSLADSEGNAVALTMSIRNLRGSGVTVGSAGFYLNNTLDDFSICKTNTQGLVQGKMNRLEPGKRPLSSQTPTVVLGPDGKVLLVTGCAGGPYIISSVFGIISNVVDEGMSASEAVSVRDRVHYQLFPDRAKIEREIYPGEVMMSLHRKGHSVGYMDPWTGIAFCPSVGRSLNGIGWTGSGDWRNRGGVSGY